MNKIGLRILEFIILCLAFSSCAFIGGLGLPEMVIIFLIILILFGANKIPRIAKDLGGGIREFKKSLSTDDSKDKDDKDQNRTA